MSTAISADFPSEIRFPSPIEESSDKVKWIELACVVASVAVVVILSAAKIISSVFVFIAKVVIITAIIKLIIIILLNYPRAENLKKETEAPEKSENRDLLERHPTLSCIAMPAIEEGIFRGVLQSGLQNLLSWMTPSKMISFFGVALPLPTFLAIGIASILFGALHLTNNHIISGQPLTAAISGFQYGLFYYRYGLLSAIFAHTMNNTFADTVSNTLDILKEKPTYEMVKV